MKILSIIEPLAHLVVRGLLRSEIGGQCEEFSTGQYLVHAKIERDVKLWRSYWRVCWASHPKAMFELFIPKNGVCLDNGIEIDREWRDEQLRGTIIRGRWGSQRTLNREAIGAVDYLTQVAWISSGVELNGYDPIDRTAHTGAIVGTTLARATLSDDQWLVKASEQERDLALEMASGPLQQLALGYAERFVDPIYVPHTSRTIGFEIFDASDEVADSVRRMRMIKERRKHFAKDGVTGDRLWPSIILASDKEHRHYERQREQKG